MVDTDRFSRDTQPIPSREPGQIPPMEPNSMIEEESIPQETILPEMELSQDDIPTPVPMPIPAPPAELRTPPPRVGVPRALWVLVVLSLMISIFSLALNGILIFRLLGVRQTVVDGLDTALAAMDNLAGKGFHYDYHFNETIPFSGDIPIKQDLVFPFKGNIPINTTVRVPVDAGVLGTFNIDVPINTVFPVDLEVPISVDQTVHVETEVPLELQIPIDVKPDDPLIQQLLGPIQEWLLQLRESM